MKRRDFVLAAGATLAMPRGLRAQAPRRIGVLSSYIPRQMFVRIPAVLRERGYVEGRDIVFDFRYAEGRSDRLPALAADLVASRVDLILAMGNEEIRAAMQATSSIPIVMALSQVPVEMGFVASLGRPGGNVTGTTIQAPETAGKMFEVLKEAVPSVRQVAVIWEEGFPGMDRYRRAGEVAIAKLGMQWTLYPVHDLAALEGAFAQLARRRPDALYVVTTGAIFTHRARIIEFAARERLPALYTSVRLPPEGGLIAYAADIEALAARTASYVERILKGARPSNLPVEQPAKFNLAVNLRTARAIGLTLPQSILMRADQVIE